MAQAKENNPAPRAKAPAAPKAAAANGTAPAGEKRTRPTTRRPYYNRRPRRAQQPKEAATPIHIYPLGGLGEVGKNFAAGMSGGIAYVLDEDNDLYMRTNKSMVFSEEVTNKYDVLELKEMIKEHVTLTNSEKGKEILDHFSEYLPKFKKVIPYDYNRMQMAIVQMEEKGLNAEQAQIEAFYASTRA